MLNKARGMPRAIKIQYDLKLTNGERIESATLSFVPGRDQILPALERKIIGLKAGEEVAGILPAKEAFGDPELLPIADLKRAEFPADVSLDIGRRFEAHTVTGADVRFEVLAVTEEVVKVRFFHPLANEDVDYRIKVIELIDLAPPPLPASALGIDSAAIQVWDSQQIVVKDDHTVN
jgi:FKBP-type peptidyl-prolyl cis-trans isomerase 2